MIKAIIFDIGNVLMYDFPMESRFLYNIYIEAKENMQDITFPQFLQMKNNYGMAYNQWIYEWGISFFKEKWLYVNHKAWYDVVSHWEDYCILIPGSIEALFRYNSKYHYAICANQSKKTLDFFRIMGLMQLFDPFVIDELVGYSKPDHRIFEIVLQQLKYSPECCLMVGDKRIVDLIPATSLDMHTVLIKNNFDEMERHVRSSWEYDYLQYCRIYNEDDGQGHFKVQSVESLFEMLERM
jgi:HAD superfamily hydrolase (TIGR01549 family)